MPGTDRQDLATTTVDTMKDFYLSPMIAMIVITCLLLFVLVVITVCWCKTRGKTVVKTMNVTPKRPATKTFSAAGE